MKPLRAQKALRSLVEGHGVDEDRDDLAVARDREALGAVGRAQVVDEVGRRPRRGGRGGRRQSARPGDVRGPDVLAEVLVELAEGLQAEDGPHPLTDVGRQAGRRAGCRVGHPVLGDLGHVDLQLLGDVGDGRRRIDRGAVRGRLGHREAMGLEPVVSLSRAASGAVAAAISSGVATSPAATLASSVAVAVGVQGEREEHVQRCRRARAGWQPGRSRRWARGRRTRVGEQHCRRRSCGQPCPHRLGLAMAGPG